MFGKRKSKDILLTCPFCNHQQNEPRSAMSTFCRSCGEHFRIKDGEAVAPKGVQVSGIATFRELGEVEVVEDTPIARLNRAVKAQPAPKKEKVQPSKSEEDSMGGDEKKPATQTTASQTGAETWLETAKKAKHEFPAEDAGVGEAEDETVEAEEAPVEKEKEGEKTSKSKRKAKKKDSKNKDRGESPDDDDEKSETDEPVPNPIALAAAEADAKDDAIRELEKNLARKNKTSLGADAQPKEALAAGSMEALLGGISTNIDVQQSADDVVEKDSKESAAIAAKSDGADELSDESPTGPLDPSKMPLDFEPTTGKKQAAADKNHKPIRCFKCNHRQQVSVAASSTQCGRCSVYISLSDYDIKTSQSQTIRTRGNVTIHRRGSLIGCDIACHDLTVLGKISGSVDCSGNATFKNSGKVMGSMHCKHLHIDKKCELTFPQGVVAESADIHGTLNGDITCSGTVKIFKTGAVNGDATAKGIVLKDGGILSGQMNIQHDVDIELPLKRGYDPSIIK